MESCANWDVDSINWSDMDYGPKPRAEHESAVTTLGRERPISHDEVPVIEGISIEFSVGERFRAATLVVMGHRGAATLLRS